MKKFKRSDLGYRKIRVCVSEDDGAELTPNPGDPVWNNHSCRPKDGFNFWSEGNTLNWISGVHHEKHNSTSHGREPVHFQTK